MIGRLRFHRNDVAKRRAGTEKHQTHFEVLLFDLHVTRAEMISEECMRPTAWAFTEQRVLTSCWGHLDFGLARVTVPPLPQMCEVVDHAGTLLVALVMTLG